MGFEIVFEDGLNCPKLICDSCSSVIHADRDGVYLWAWGGGRIYFAHHNSVGTKRCHERLERELPDLKLWHHLREFFRFIDTNLSRTDPLGHRANKEHTDAHILLGDAS